MGTHLTHITRERSLYLWGREGGVWAASIPLPITSCSSNSSPQALGNQLLSRALNSSPSLFAAPLKVGRGNGTDRIKAIMAAAFEQL